jgi:ParB family chromosome partitioning protein
MKGFSQMLTMLPVESIVPAEDNLRRRIGDVRDLASSITAVGIVEPLLVSPAGDGRYVIVAGHRRHAAAQNAGLTQVPCTIRTLSEAERVELMLVENLQRSDLSAIEEASGYFRLVEHGLKPRELARRIGRSAKHVAARLALLELPKAVCDEIHARSLSVGDGQALLALREYPEVIARLVADEWSRDNIERAVLREQHRIEAATHAPSQRDTATQNDGATERSQQSRNSASARVDPYAEEHARSKARAAAKAARIAFAQGLVVRRLPKTDVQQLIADQFLADVSATHAKTACRILGIDAIDGSWGPDYRGAVEAHAARSTADRDRAVLAVALSIGEEVARHGAESPAATRHIEFLAAYGYEPEATSAA